MRPGDKTDLRGLGAILLALATVGCGGGSDASPQPAAAEQDDALRVYSTIPSFELTDQRGEPFGSSQLAGKTWVANFIFTSCPGTCPIQTSYVKQLQDRLQTEAAWPEIRLVSFTVDPQTDTPEVLLDYAERVGADPDQWIFVTGGKNELWQLSKDGFKLPVGDAPPGGDGPILHATKLMLIDGAGQVRGYYDGMSEEGLLKLEADLGRVLDEHN